MKDLVLQEAIEQKIFLIRGQNVMLSVHLAKLYGVETKTLMQAVKRNIERFPEDFMFQLTWEEMQSLRSQIVTLDSKRPETSQERQAYQVSPSRLYGTRGGYAFQRPAKQTRYSG